MKNKIKKKKRNGRPTLHEKRYENVGRPTKFTPEVVAKLEQAFANAFTDSQACIFAGVSKDALYYYISKNPSFHDRKESLKKRVDIKAKTKLIEAINEGDVSSAKWWLERKCKDEFSLKTETELSGEVKSKVIYIEKEEKEAYKKHIDKVIDGD